MRIEVKGLGFNASAGLGDYAGLRLMSVLDHLVRHVEGVTVWLDGDAADDRLDKRCRMLAQLGPAGEAQVEAVARGAYEAIDRAAERLARGVARARTRRAPIAGLPAKSVRERLRVSAGQCSGAPAAGRMENR